MRTHSRRARAQILPLFVFLSLIMLAFAALLIDGAGVILVSQDFDSLTARAAQFAASQYALTCVPTIDNIPGSGCTVTDTTPAGLNDSLTSYIMAWTTGGPDRIGIPAKEITWSMSYPDDHTVTITLGGCYSPFLLKSVIAALGGPPTSDPGCSIGDIYMSRSASAIVMLSD